MYLSSYYYNNKIIHQMLNSSNYVVSGFKHDIHDVPSSI